MFEFIKMYDDVELPQYKTMKSSGLDIKAYIKNDYNKIIIPSMSHALISTGLKLKFKTDVGTLNVEAQIRGRSGLALNHQVIVLNSPGTIDEDYEGEIKIILFNLSESHYTVRHGDRIAQIVFCNILRHHKYIQNSIRGEGGFGSTGK
jgi:dUTP pyrophosphatase